MNINGYPSIYAVGHRAIVDIFKTPVLIEEKIDGSQFSMMKENGELKCRSKGKELFLDAPEKMFIQAIEIAKTLPLAEGYIYRCEYLSKPKHNTLNYDRVPTNNLIVFDIQTGIETYMEYTSKFIEAQRIGLETVGKIYEGTVENFEGFTNFLDRESQLGGCKIEGFVVKNYTAFTETDKKIMIAKYVSEAFKEKHMTDWHMRNPKSNDVVQDLINTLRTDARWQKAIQHLREAGQLDESPKDIGNLIKEVHRDITKEETDFIKDRLFKHCLPQILRGATSGLPEWYKETLAKNSFTPVEDGLTVDVAAI